ncbi:hypothetical protein BDC45DRAFT_521841 [Circinella umbellata]|nr:hypothetical protein BDC45DRAFT_521841 [Circinella umbellata]
MIFLHLVSLLFGGAKMGNSFASLECGPLSAGMIFTNDYFTTIALLTWGFYQKFIHQKIEFYFLTMVLLDYSHQRNANQVTKLIDLSNDNKTMHEAIFSF